MQWCDSQTTYVKVVKTICWQPSEQYYLCQTYWGYWINRSLLPLLCVQLLIFKYNCTEVLKTNIPCNIANNIFLRWLQNCFTSVLTWNWSYFVPIVLLLLTSAHWSKYVQHWRYFRRITVLVQFRHCYQY